MYNIAIAARMDFVAWRRLLRITGIYSSRIFPSKPSPLMILSCLINVLLPLSPDPGCFRGVNPSAFRRKQLFEIKLQVSINEGQVKCDCEYARRSVYNRTKQKKFHDLFVHFFIRDDLLVYFSVLPVLIGLLRRAL